MIEPIEGLPGEVVGFEAVGEVTSDDYGVVAPAVERALASNEETRLPHVTGDRFTGHTASSALQEDTRLGLTNALGWSLPGETKLFSTAERGEAETWVGEGLARPGARQTGRADTGPAP